MQIPITGRPFVRKGAGVPRIDWRNPLTVGLARYVLLDLRLDLVTNKLGAITGSPKPSSLPSGGALDTTSAVNYIGFPSIAYTSAVTISCEALVQGASSVPLIYNCDPSGTESLYLWVDTGSNIYGPGVIVGGAFNGGYNDCHGGNANNSTFNSNHFAYVNNTANAWTYFNGSQVATIASPAPGTISNAQFMVGFPNTGGFLTGTVRVGYAALWTRALSAVEIASLHAQPYQFLIYPEDEIFAELVGAAAAGAAPFTQDDWPLPVQPPRLDQSWAWRQTGMLGQDRLPNRQQDWPLPTPSPRLDQTWTWMQTDMIGQDRLPFRQQDWPLPVPPPPGTTWTWRQTGMLGQDRLPFRQQNWPNPVQPSRIDATWVQGFAIQLQTPAVPFRQQDWPNPVGVPYFDQTWLGQGIMSIPAVNPFVQTDWPNPITLPSFDRTWIFNQTIRLTPVVAIPFTNYDWPNPIQPPRLDQTWTWRQTGQFGQDRLPNRQQDWPLPVQPSRIDATWAQGSTLLLSQVVILYPKNQYDWPLPTPPPRLDQTWTWRQVGMAGQDRLPFRQQDWPLPTPPARLDQTFAWRQTGMFGQDRMPAGGRTFFALSPHPIKWIDLTWNFGPYVPTPPPPLITVVYSKQFFSQIGSIMGIPGDPPS